MNRVFHALVLALVFAAAASAADPGSETYRHLQPREVFDLEWASSPRTLPTMVRSSLADLLKNAEALRECTSGAGSEPLVRSLDEKCRDAFSLRKVVARDGS